MCTQRHTDNVSLTNNPWTISYRQPILIVIQFYEVDIEIERSSAIATLTSMPVG
jgi:hypothetical protein